MKNQIGKFIVYLLSICMLSLVSFVSAGAYILRGPHIIELMTQNFGQPRTLLVSQRVVFYDHRFEKGVIEASETVRYVFPDTFRSDSRTENAERIQLVVQGEDLTIVNGKIAVADEFQFDLYKDILLYRSRALLSERLTYLGIDITLSSLARFQDTIALILGAETSGSPVNQIWLDKESFRPIRWLMPGKDVDGRPVMWEIRYHDWRQVNSAWYPMHMRFFRDDLLMREIRVEQMTVNPAFPEDLFDMARLRFNYLPEAMETTGDTVSDELNEVQETIDDFRKKYE